MSILGGGLGGFLTPSVSSAFDGATQWLFFKIIFEFLDDEVIAFRDNMLGETFTWIGGVASLLMILWIFLQGYRIATGQSRDSMMVLVTNSLRAVLIVAVATTLSFGSTDLYGTFTQALPAEITKVVTGAESDPVDSIDDSLTAMQGAMIGIDALAGNDASNKDDKDRAMWMTGIGVAGPSVVGGALLLLYKLALALFIGLGPFFILCLLFEQTKPLFSRWLYYGVGTMFSLSVLSFMVAVAMKMTLAVAASFAAQYLVAMSTGTPPAGGVSSMAMQQGGLGLILSVLIVMTPPMAAQFFQGTLGSFSPYSSFGVTRPVDAGGRPMPAYASPAQRDSSAGSDFSRTRPETPLNRGAAAGTGGLYSPAPDEIKSSSDMRRGG